MKHTIIILLLLILVGCTKREVIFDSELNENFEQALILKFNGKDCLFDQSTGTFKFLINESDLESFKPTIHFQDFTSVTFNNLKLKNNQINNLGELMSNVIYPISFTVNNEISEFNLIFTTIPQVHVLTFDPILNEPKTLAKMRLFDIGENSLVEEFYVGIELRGRSSLLRDKKSYGFRVLQKSDLNFPISKSLYDLKIGEKWSLDGLVIDQSKVRNKTSFDIWKDLGHTSIDSKYVELFLNNKSLGLYRLSNVYDKELLNLNSNSSLYVGVDNSDYTKFNAFPNKQSKSAVWNEWEQEFPNPSESIYWNDFYTLNDIIVNSSDSNFVNEIFNHIDFENVIDYYLFISLCYGYDNVGKNWYFLKQSSNEKFKLLIWDLDATWGRNHNALIQPTNLQVQNNLFERLLTINPNNFKQQLKARWNSLRASKFSFLELKNKFDANFVELNQYKIISTENQIWNESLNLLNEQDFINSWTENRLLFLDDYFNEL